MALAAVLTTRSVLAAPAKLAGAVVSTSLVAATTGVAVSGGLVGAAKLKVLIPSACAVALLVGVVWQQQALNRLREENATLRGAQMAAMRIRLWQAQINGRNGGQRRLVWCVAKSGDCDEARKQRSWQQLALSTVLPQAATKVDSQIHVRLCFCGTDEAIARMILLMLLRRWRWPNPKRGSNQTG